MSSHTLMSWTSSNKASDISEREQRDPGHESTQWESSGPTSTVLLSHVVCRLPSYRTARETCTKQSASSARPYYTLYAPAVTGVEYGEVQVAGRSTSRSEKR